MKTRTHWIDEQSRVLLERKKDNGHKKYKLNNRLNIYTISSERRRILIPSIFKELLLKDYEKLTERGLSCDFMAYLASLVAKKEFQYRSSKTGKGARLCMEVLSKINFRAKEYVDYLIENNIIEIVKDYSADTETPECRTYALCPEMNEISTYQLSEAKMQSVIDDFETIKEEVQNNLIQINHDSNIDFVRHLQLNEKWKNEKILLGKCREEIHHSFWAKYTMHLMLEFHNSKSKKEVKRVLGFAHSEKHNRIYDNFKSIPKTLKPCFIYSQNGEKHNLADLDIPNSHPLFLVLEIVEFYYNFLRRSTRLSKNNLKELQKYGITNIKANKAYVKLNTRNKWARKLSSINNNHPYVEVEIDLDMLKKELTSLVECSFKGLFYEQFYSNNYCIFHDVKLKYENRDAVKKPFMYFLNDEIFSKNSEEFRNALLARYPNFLKLIIVIRLQDNSYKDLGYRLAQSESEIRLGIIKKCKKNRPRKIQLFDMHDGFLTPNIEENIQYIENAFVRLVLTTKRKKMLACLKEEWKFVNNLPQLRLVDKSEKFR